MIGATRFLKRDIALSFTPSASIESEALSGLADYKTSVEACFSRYGAKESAYSISRLERVKKKRMRQTPAAPADEGQVEEENMSISR